MRLVSPRAVLARVARQVPKDCRHHIVVIGSLAAAYQLFPEPEETPVRTKDIDCILVPRIEAIRTGKAVEITVAGRHDTCIALRVPVVVEAAAAVVLADLMLLEQLIPRVVREK